MSPSLFCALKLIKVFKMQNVMSHTVLWLSVIKKYVTNRNTFYQASVKYYKTSKINIVSININLSLRIYDNKNKIARGGTIRKHGVRDRWRWGIVSIETGRRRLCYRLRPRARIFLHSQSLFNRKLINFCIIIYSVN